MALQHYTIILSIREYFFSVTAFSDIAYAHFYLKVVHVAHSVEFSYRRLIFRVALLNFDVLQCRPTFFTLQGQHLLVKGVADVQISRNGSFLLIVPSTPQNNFTYNQRLIQIKDSRGPVKYNYCNRFSQSSLLSLPANGFSLITDGRMAHVVLVWCFSYQYLDSVKNGVIRVNSSFSYYTIFTLTFTVKDFRHLQI